MTRITITFIFIGCVFCNGLFAQQEKAKPQKSKTKQAKEVKCVPESKPDTVNIDLKTGKPKTAKTDTTLNKN